MSDWVISRVISNVIVVLECEDSVKYELYVVNGTCQNVSFICEAATNDRHLRLTREKVEKRRNLLEEPSRTCT